MEIIKYIMLGFFVWFGLFIIIALLRWIGIIRLSDKTRMRLLVANALLFLIMFIAMIVGGFSNP